MRYWATLALVFAIFAAANAEVTTAQSQGMAIAGNYTVQGTNPDQSTYIGTVTITATPAGFRFDWQIGNGDTYTGTSTTVSGSTISVDWGQQYPVIYVLGPDRVLHGTWDNGRATETLTPK